MGRGMKAGKKPGGGMGGMGGGGGQQAAMQKQMRQIQEMQRKMEELQSELDDKEVTATAGGGVVSATVNGKKELTKLELKPEAVDPDDIEMLQDLILAAVNEALRQIEELSNAEMSRLTGGMGLPGA